MRSDREYQGLQAENNVRDAVSSQHVLENYTVLNSIEVQQVLQAINNESNYKEDNTSFCRSLVEKNDMYM